MRTTGLHELGVVIELSSHAVDHSGVERTPVVKEPVTKGLQHQQIHLRILVVVVVGSVKL